MGPKQPDSPGSSGTADDEWRSSPSDPRPSTSVPVPWAGLPELPPDFGSSVPVSATQAARAPATPLAERSVERPTITATMRSMQPRDVGRQVMGELGMLATELDALPDLLMAAGMARSGLQVYLDIVQDYLSLSHFAWEAVSEEQLEQVGIEEPYRDATVDVARRLNDLKQQCSTTPVRGRRRRPLLWGRRIALVRAGLHTWRGTLAPVPDPLRLGHGLFVMQGAIGLASAGSMELALVDMLVSATGALLALLSMGTLLLLAAAIGAGSANTAVAYGVASFIGLVGLMATLAVGLISPLPLGPLLGASIFVPAHAASLGWQGSRAIAGILRAWWLLIGSIATLALPLSLVLGGALLDASGPLTAPKSAVSALHMGGNVLLVALTLPAGVCVVALVALALPFVVLAMARFDAELASNRQWVPAARRYAMAPALTVTIMMTVALLSAAWAVSMRYSWEHMRLLNVDTLGVHGALTVRFLVFALVVAVPYLVLDFSYRLGTSRWRAYRASALASRRADLESQVRRLATQPATDQVLRAMQYDLVLLQFYRGQIDEARKTMLAPYPVAGVAIVLIIAVASALLLDSGSTILPHLLMPH